MLDDNDFLTVTDLKQYSFCQRVIFYERCLPHLRPRTHKMDAGRDAHVIERKRATRRVLTQYQVVEGERRFDVRLRSERLGLVGEIDEVVYAQDGIIIPVDYKLAKRVGEHHRLQLCAYAMMLEETAATPVERGYIYLIPKHKLIEVQFDAPLRQALENSVTAIRQMVEWERMPPPAQQINRCVACEFRRFCNDVGL